MVRWQNNENGEEWEGVEEKKKSMIYIVIYLFKLGTKPNFVITRVI